MNGEIRREGCWREGESSFSVRVPGQFEFFFFRDNMALKNTAEELKLTSP